MKTLISLGAMLILGLAGIYFFIGVIEDRMIFYPVSQAGHNDLYLVGGRPYFLRLKQFTETLQ